MDDGRWTIGICLIILFFCALSAHSAVQFFGFDDHAPITGEGLMPRDTAERDAEPDAWLDALTVLADLDHACADIIGVLH